MELWAIQNPEHEYIRILEVSTCIAELQSVYQDELFFKVKKNIGLSFFNFDSFGFSLFAFRFSTKALGKNIIFVCFSNSERKWLVSPENPPQTLSSVFYGDFIFTLVTIFPSYSSLHSRIHGLAVLKIIREWRTKSKVYRNGHRSVHRNFFVCTVKATRKRIPKKKNHRWDVAPSNSLIVSNRRPRDLRGTGFINLTFQLSPKTQPPLWCPSKLIPTF